MVPTFCLIFSIESKLSNIKKKNHLQSNTVKNSEKNIIFFDFEKFSIQKNFKKKFHFLKIPPPLKKVAH